MKKTFITGFGLLCLTVTTAGAQVAERQGDHIGAHGLFQEDTAMGLLAALEQEKDEGLRTSAAKAFYLLFYDVRSVQESAFGFLSGQRMTDAFRERLLSDPNPEVRRYMAQLGQVMPLGFDGPEAGALAWRYVPVLLDGLGQADAALKNEILVALENFKQKAADEFGAEEVRRRIQEAMAREADPDFKGMMEELISIP